VTTPAESQSLRRLTEVVWVTGQRPRRSEDKWTRYWLSREPYCTPHQLTLMLDDWDPDQLQFTTTDPPEPPTQLDWFALDPRGVVAR
jgi:hypothetical protein